MSGSRPIVLPTANEYRHALTEPDWVLAVVINALSNNPSLRVYGPRSTRRRGAVRASDRPPLASVIDE